MLIETSGDVNKDVDKTIPPYGVALPVKFVLPADIVNNILQRKHVLNIIAHWILLLGLTNKSANPFKLDQSRKNGLIISKSYELSIL